MNNSTLSMNIILCITEGEKADPKILKQLVNEFHLVPRNNVKIVPICLNIYNLYHRMSQKSDDNNFDGNFLDVFSVIQEISKEQPSSLNQDFLQLNRNQVSEIFLFFDYDGHDTLAPEYPDCINNMLNLFNNETENGKLYINYPMVESYKHPLRAGESVDIHPITHYKEYVSSICDCSYNQISKLKKSDWMAIFIEHIKATNYLFNSSYCIPVSYTNSLEMSQVEIYSNQKSKYILSNKVMVLNSFAWFLLEYIGQKLFNEMKEL